MKKPSGIKDKNALKYIEYLETELKKFTQNPLVESYRATYHFINKINGQIITNQIDIFDEDFKKVYDMLHKFLIDKQSLLQDVEITRKSMTPEQEKELQRKLAVDNLPMAEKMAIMNGK